MLLLTIGSSTGKRVSRTKALGVHITEGLSWSKNIGKESPRVPLLSQQSKEIKCPNTDHGLYLSWHNWRYLGQLYKCVVWNINQKTLQCIKNETKKAIGASLLTCPPGWFPLPMRRQQCNLECNNQDKVPSAWWHTKAVNISVSTKFWVGVTV